jgi:phosphoribosyl 1,2-cyclic phosphodiesterase
MKHGSQKLAIATDMGTYNDYTVESLKGMDVLFLEANHDVNMLQVGPYPYALKQRILGDKGHLSNELSGKLLDRLVHDKLQAVVLGHLSRENNIPELAYETVRVELAMGQTEFMGNEFPITVAKRDEVSPVIRIA